MDEEGGREKEMEGKRKEIRRGQRGMYRTKRNRVFISASDDG